MGKRTKNRIIEHSRPGHKLEEKETPRSGNLFVLKPPGMSFWLCTCGWEGWLTDRVNDPEPNSDYGKRWS